MICFANRLRSLRHAAQLTDNELAKELSISISFLSGLESSKIEPGLNLIIKIANYFNVSVDFLIGKELITEVNVEGLNIDAILLVKHLIETLKKSIDKNDGEDHMGKPFERLKELRLEHSLKQRDLAELLNVHQTTYGSYERGELQPPITTLIFLANLYHVSIDYLVGRTETK